MHHSTRDITGKKFGRLVVVRATDRRVNRSIVWECLCECGALTEATSGRLRTGDKRSCGCLATEVLTARNKIGKPNSVYRTPEYRTWVSMIQRCTNKNGPSYSNYGGRGIRVCDRWMDSFHSFFEDMGVRPSDKHSIDRIDNGGNYEPGNCRWATAREQCRNSRQAFLITAFGVTKPAGDWADDLGVDSVVLRCRIRRYGWSPEKAVTTPAKFSRKKPLEYR